MPKQAMSGRKNALNMFAEAARARAAQNAPLAARMRPRTLDEFVGQEHIVGAGTRCAAAIEEDRVPSMMLWGPPGSGKDDAGADHRLDDGPHFENVSAVSSGVADLRRVVAEAADAWRTAARARSSSSTRSTASTRRSRTSCCLTSRTARSR